MHLARPQSQNLDITIILLGADLARGARLTRRASHAAEADPTRALRAVLFDFHDFLSPLSISKRRSARAYLTWRRV